jgi:hypothetical protein
MYDSSSGEPRYLSRNGKFEVSLDLRANDLHELMLARRQGNWRKVNHIFAKYIRKWPYTGDSANPNDYDKLNLIQYLKLFVVFIWTIQYFELIVTKKSSL